jgi:hypothetical protein
MIRIDELGQLRFEGILYRDNSMVTRLVAKLDAETAACLAKAFDDIERGKIAIARSLLIGWYRTQCCGFWVFISVEPEQTWADIVLLSEVSS